MHEFPFQGSASENCTISVLFIHEFLFQSSDFEGCTILYFMKYEFIPPTSSYDKSTTKIACTGFGALTHLLLAVRACIQHRSWLFLRKNPFFYLN